MLLAPLLLCPRIPHSHPSKCPQHCPTYTGEPFLKSQPNPPLVDLGPDPNQGHPCRWIHGEMEKTIHPHWWKEIKASGRVSMGSHIVREGLSNSEALQWAQWQVATFRLLLAQHKTSGWWEIPPWLRGLCPADFMLCTNASGLMDFWAMRQKKTLALASVLQVCAKWLEVPRGVLCMRTSKMYGPLMTLSEADTTEVSLLRPSKEEH